ncbi:MAG: hypothetical protein ABIT58_04120 [Ferruginibacter sp.]
MNIKDAKNIRIDDFLESLGHACAKVSAGRKWYKRPYGNENTPSFVLSQDCYAWYDHGEGRGGGIIELAMRYADLREVSEALSYIDRVIGNDYVIQPPRMEYKKMEPEAYYEVIRYDDFRIYVGRGMSKGAQYLVSRCIDPDALASYVKDVKFNTKNNVKKKYQGIGIANNAGGYEVRYDDGHGYKKATVGPKAVSFFSSTVKGSENGTLHIFEGAPDFYTYLTWNSRKTNSINPASQNYLVINGTGMTAQAIEFLVANPHRHVALWSQYGAGGQKMEDELFDYLSNTDCIAGTTKEMYAPPADLPDAELSKWDLNAWYVSLNKSGLLGIPKLKM